jgi:MinD superfamily P-loop ATPase
VKELVVISGKGGTGKTSVVAAFAALAGNTALADCDVDAANLHLLLDPQVQETHEFIGGSIAVIDPENCTVCGLCEELCRFGAPHNGSLNRQGMPAPFEIEAVACEGCGVCARFCPSGAIKLQEAVNGQWFVSKTRHGPMVHARMGIAEENSGKLVSLVREKSREVAASNGCETIIVDGSPGIGCPVIASLTGAKLALIITEPTLSGLHDLQRIGELTKHFGIPTMVSVNKYDLNEDIAGRIEGIAREGGMEIGARVRYDPVFTQAMIHRQSVVEYTEEGASVDLRKLWDVVQIHLASSTKQTTTTGEGDGK